MKLNKTQTRIAQAQAQARRPYADSIMKHRECMRALAVALTEMMREYEPADDSVNDAILLARSALELAKQYGL